MLKVNTQERDETKNSQVPIKHMKIKSKIYKAVVDIFVILSKTKQHIVLLLLPPMRIPFTVCECTSE